MKKKLAVIGAGIAGLTLANFIKKYSDHEFMVYEREESLSLEEGYGIQLGTNAVKILNQIREVGMLSGFFLFYFLYQFFQILLLMINLY